MDRNEIEKAVVLPIENPEETYYYVTTDEVLKACKRHPDRLIPFCNVDPRRGDADTSTLERNQNKLLFGTNYLTLGQKCRQVELLPPL